MRDTREFALVHLPFFDGLPHATRIDRAFQSRACMVVVDEERTHARGMNAIEMWGASKQPG